jgi:hypothetical protein
MILKIFIYFKGGELKKEVDDTFTQSVMANLNISLMSCGALINDGNLEGTVFRVGSKYVMTAYHVIKDIKRKFLNLAGIVFYLNQKINKAVAVYNIYE